MLNYLLPLPISILQTLRLTSWVLYPLNWRVNFLTLLHAINGAYTYRKNLLNENVKIPFIQGFVSYILMSLGGTLTAGILIGIAPGWLINDNVLPVYFLVYCIFFLDKEGRITKLIAKGGLTVELISAFINATSRTTTLAGLINMIRDYKDPYITNSIICLLVCGTLSGCGGGILDHTFNLSKKEWKYNTPSCLKGENSFSLKSTIISTFLYIVLSNPMNEDMIGFFGFIIKCRQLLLGDLTRVQAMTLTWIFFVTIYLIYTYYIHNKYLPYINIPSLSKYFGGVSDDVEKIKDTNKEKDNKKDE